MGSLGPVSGLRRLHRSPVQLADDANWAMAGSLQSLFAFNSNLSPGIIQRLVEDGVKIGAV